MGIMIAVQAHMKKQAGQNQAQQPGAQTYRQEQEQAQHQRLVKQAHLGELRWIGLSVIADSSPYTQSAPSHGMPEIVIGIDKNARGKRDPDISFEPGPDGDGGKRREFYMFLRTHPVSAF
jgi:hypothetical protein